MIEHRPSSLFELANASHPSVSEPSVSERDVAGDGVLADKNADAAITVNADRLIVAFNAAAEALLHCPMREAVGSPLVRFIPHRLQESYIEYFKVFWRLGSRMLSQTPVRAPITLVATRPSGDEIPVEAVFVRETPDTVTIVLHDVRLRRRTEENLRRTEIMLAGIIGSAMDAIISVNEAQEIVIFNAAAEKLFGYRESEMLGQSIHRLLPHRFRDEHRRHISTFGTTGVTTRSMGELRPLVARRADGSEFPIEATISQLVVGEEKLFSVILRDVSERRRAEAERDQLWHATERQAVALKEQTERLEVANRELLRLAAEAATANQAKSNFLAVMSHELRTPLNAISGYAELLEMGVRGPLTPEQLADVNRIQKSQKHLLTLIDEVLNFAKLETGRIEYHLAEFLVHDVLSNLEVLVQPQLRTKGLTYTYTQPSGGLLAYADSEKTQQIMLNLLSNAVKFTPPGGHIAVSCKATGDAVMIEVRDTGRGIPKDRLKSIFEPFVQVDAHLTRESGGVGLGLAISRDLATAMKGTLRAESEAGEGATFTLSLLRYAPETPAAAT